MAGSCVAKNVEMASKIWAVIFQHAENGGVKPPSGSNLQFGDITGDQIANTISNAKSSIKRGTASNVLRDRYYRLQRDYPNYDKPVKCGRKKKSNKKIADKTMTSSVSVDVVESMPLKSAVYNQQLDEKTFVFDADSLRRAVRNNGNLTIVVKGDTSLKSAMVESEK